ncbi:cysteine peptidase family C39 domain-containing protein [Bacteroides timonensis]|uniref:hypothetical protein n=1 Tax=Bacteroides timonensis TaxID=1470345 RepID=UPI0005C741B8|nr:hypothetical protein [Bacteroides timonensis]
MIKIIEALFLTEKGCCIKNRTDNPIHIKQGDIDGACSVYSLMMYLMILKVIKRNQLDDLYDTLKKTPEVENLFCNFFDKYGLVRNGFYFSQLEKMLNRKTIESISAESFDDESKEYLKDGFIEQIQNTIDLDSPIMLGIDYKGGGAHAVLAIGYEKNEDGIFNIFCLDPGYDCNPTSYWNMVIALNSFRGVYKHQCLTSNPYNCPAIKITETLLITRK